MKRLIVRQGLLLMMVAILTGSAGWHASKWYTQYYETHADRRVVLKGYELTSPLLDVELPEGLNIDREPFPFKYRIVSLIKKKMAGGRLKNISVYYRDLHDGPWFCVNCNVEFDPASMMKVPVMIAWLKRAEKDPAVLKQTMKYEESKDTVPEQYTKPAFELASGQKYSVEELLHYMLRYSDNKATSLLYDALSDKERDDVLEDMDINNNPTEDSNSMTVHGYSGFFRILYNAAYLNRDMSEKALQLLSMQDFHLGIAAGVPEGIKVAGKFGEIIPKNKNEDIQLHDFGIVYHPRSHYILGVMTRGHDYAAQAKIIQDISKMVYLQVDSSIKN